VCALSYPYSVHLHVHSYCAGAGTADLEEALQVTNGMSAGDLIGQVQWRKSTASNPSGNCVEMAPLADGAVAVRNSRFPDGPVLVYTRAEVTAFLAGVKNGEFDDLGG
jgi:hypothetical protein